MIAWIKKNGNVEGAKSDLSERLQGLKEYYKCLLSLRRVCRRMTEINTAIEDRSTEFDKYRFVSKVALVTPSEEIKNLLADRVHEYRLILMFQKTWHISLTRILLCD